MSLYPSNILHVIIINEWRQSSTVVAKYPYNWCSTLWPLCPLCIPFSLALYHSWNLISISISISNNFIVSQYTFSIIHKYTKRLHQHIHKQFSESIQCYGSKWSWKSCWIYGLLVWYTKYHLSQQGCKGAGGATVTTHFVSNMQHTAL